MNFFDPNCQEPARSDAEFGICDDQNGGKAYTDVLDRSKWIAIVNNTRNVILTFTAIDKCVILDSQHVGRGRCDGMLTSVDHLYFIELKDQRENWKPHAIDQLESTIQFFLEHNGLPPQKHKKAFACNRRHSAFQFIENELNKRFFTEYKFRVDAQATVLIV